MKQSFRANISANTIQLCINQVFGLAIFYFLSKGLTKSDFGELNWTLAIFLTVYSVLSFGIDQIIIKKIAAGEDKSRCLSFHFFHVIITGILFYTILVILSFLRPSFFYKHELLLLLGAGKMLLFFATPFKAVAAGTEHFRAVLCMSVSSSIIKGLCVCYLFFTNSIALSLLIPIFVVADFSELMAGFYLTRKILKIRFFLFPGWKDYFALLKEAYPQIGVVLFSSALARVDWILIGFFLSASRLAEYSFAYKAFELACLPMLIVAPLLIPHFTRLVQEGRDIHQNKNLQLLLRIELMIACLVALCMNIAWTPVVDNITGGKYGAANTRTILILSLTLPILYLNNFLWTIHFARSNMKIILQSFLLSFLVNLVGNLVLVPLYQNEGAAFSYLLSVTLQTFFYLLHLNEKKTIGWHSLFFCAFCALCSGAASRYSSLPVWSGFPLCIGLYVLLLLCTIQLRKTDWQLFKQVLKT